MSGSSSRSPRQRGSSAGRRAGWRGTVESFGGFLTLGSIGAAVLLVVALVVWTSSGGNPAGGSRDIPVGRQVESFQLPEVDSGETFAASEYLGDRPMVIVSYMGFF